MCTTASPRSAVVTEPPSREYGLKRRQDNSACTFDKTGGPIFCTSGSLCVTANSLASCQTNAAFATYSNTTTGSSRAISITSSTPTPVTLPPSQSTESATEESNSRATSSVTSLDSTPRSSITIESTAKPTSTYSNDPNCPLVGFCTHPSPTVSSTGIDPTSTTAMAGAGMSPTNNLPVVIPSTFVVIFALIFAVVSGRRKWISKAYRRLSQERQLRRSRSSIRRSRSSTRQSYPIILAPDDDTIPLRDLEAPPPAYSPYNFSWVALGASYAPEGPRLGAGDVDADADADAQAESEREMIGQAYPLGDSGRHRST